MNPFDAMRFAKKKAGNITRIAALTSLTGSLSGGQAALSLSGLTLVTGDVLVCALVLGAVTTDQTAATLQANISGNGSVLTDDYANGTTSDTNLFTGLVAPSVSDTTVTWDFTSGATAYVAHIIQYRGVNAAPAVDVTSLTANGTATDRPNPPSITPVTANAMIVEFYAASQTTLTAWTAPGDVSNFVQTAASSKGRLGSGDKVWTSGAFDAAALTGGGANAADSWCAAAIALRPK